MIWAWLLNNQSIPAQPIRDTLGSTGSGRSWKSDPLSWAQQSLQWYVWPLKERVWIVGIWFINTFQDASVSNVQDRLIVAINGRDSKRQWILQSKLLFWQALANWHVWLTTKVVSWPKPHGSQQLFGAARPLNNPGDPDLSHPWLEAETAIKISWFRLGSTPQGCQFRSIKALSPCIAIKCISNSSHMCVCVLFQFFKYHMTSQRYKTALVSSFLCLLNIKLQFHHIRPFFKACDRACRESVRKGWKSSKGETVGERKWPKRHFAKLPGCLKYSPQNVRGKLVVARSEIETGATHWHKCWCAYWSLFQMSTTTKSAFTRSSHLPRRNCNAHNYQTSQTLAPQ